MSRLIRSTFCQKSGTVELAGARPVMLIGKLMDEKACRSDHGEGILGLAVDELRSQFERQRGVVVVNGVDASTQALTSLDQNGRLSCLGKITRRRQSGCAAAQDHRVNAAAFHL